MTQAQHSFLEGILLIVLAQPVCIANAFLLLLNVFAHPLSKEMRDTSFLAVFCIPKTPPRFTLASYFDSEVLFLSSMLCNKN
jgi:hypothetical protein